MVWKTCGWRVMLNSAWRSAPTQRCFKWKRDILCHNVHPWSKPTEEFHFFLKVSERDIFSVGVCRTAHDVKSCVNWTYCCVCVCRWGSAHHVHGQEQAGPEDGQRHPRSGGSAPARLFIFHRPWWHHAQTTRDSDLQQCHQGKTDRQLLHYPPTIHLSSWALVTGVDGRLKAFWCSG